MTAKKPRPITIPAHIAKSQPPLRGTGILSYQDKKDAIHITGRLGGSAGVRRESRQSRVPAGRIHFARGCQIKKGTPLNRQISWGCHNRTKEIPHFRLLQLLSEPASFMLQRTDTAVLTLHEPVFAITIFPISDVSNMASSKSSTVPSVWKCFCTTLAGIG